MIHFKEILEKTRKHTTDSAPIFLIPYPFPTLPFRKEDQGTSFSPHYHFLPLTKANYRTTLQFLFLLYLSVSYKHDFCNLARERLQHSSMQIGYFRQQWERAEYTPQTWSNNLKDPLGSTKTTAQKYLLCIENTSNLTMTLV